jgi:thiamine pyrophosphokinase
MSETTVILANGKFPEHDNPVGILKNAARIICCDGSAGPLLEFGLEPTAIVGDCDSLESKIIEKYGSLIYRIPEQETNDLSKSVKWCFERGFMEIVILGATGKREDHTIGNISLLTEFAKSVNVKMVTDTGIFYPLLKSSRIDSNPGQNISIFSIDPQTEISTSGLKYPLVQRRLKNWWEATLNEAISSSFSLDFTGGPLIVYIKF